MRQAETWTGCLAIHVERETNQKVDDGLIKITKGAEIKVKRYNQQVTLLAFFSWDHRYPANSTYCLYGIEYVKG